jgi:hypothetical protein
MPSMFVPDVDVKDRFGPVSEVQSVQGIVCLVAVSQYIAIVLLIATFFP